MAYDLTKPSDPDLPPGAARCPGPSTRDLILADGDRPPDALLAQRYEFLGDADIPFERYSSRSGFDLEMAKLWTRTWQWVCREEHIPHVGDYRVYDIGTYSFIVVRSAPDRIQAFYNSCLHRGMQLCEPGSSGTSKQFFRCPFHGFTWHVDGSLKEIPCRWDFPHIDDTAFCLPEARVATWGGFVFINMDPGAAPLDAFLEVLPEHFRAWPLEQRYVALHVVKTLPANWKMAMEAFLEAFHVLATHPEGLKTASDANAQYDIFGKHVTRFIHTIGHPSPHLKTPPSQDDMLKALGGWNLVADAGHVPPDHSARAMMAEHLRATLGERYDVDLSNVSTSEMMDSIEYHLFPNMCLFPGISLPMIYRFRPNGTDVDSSIHEILFLAPLPASGVRPAPAEPVHLDEDDSYRSVPGFSPGLAFVLDQDTANLRRQRDGAKAAFKRGQTLGNYQEARIRRFHLTLDEYLERA